MIGKYLRRKNEIDPKVKALFPWSLFLVVAVLFAVLAFLAQAHGAALFPQPATTTHTTWFSWTCDDLRSYLATHTEAEARAEAVKRHLPQWLIKKAEKCLP